MSKLPEKVWIQPVRQEHEYTANDRPSSQSCYGADIEYIRADIADKMAKEFAEFIRYNTKPVGGGKYRANKKYLTEADKVFSLDELFTEFKNKP